MRQQTMPNERSLPPYKFFASTVCLLTSRREGGRPNVMACEWTMCVCWQPLRVMALVCRDDWTHELIAASREFGVNLCSDQQAALAHLAGSSSGRTEDKLADPLFENQLYRASRIQAPMIRGCVLNVECKLEQQIPMGEYTAFIGRGVEARANPGLVPLVYHRAQYFGLGGNIPKPLASVA